MTDKDNILEKRVEKEILCYKAEETVKNPNSVDVIDWWKNKSGAFPLLSNAARFVFSIPAGSSATENSFSAVGFIFSDRRTKMKPKTLENLLLLRSNQDLQIDIAINVNRHEHDEYYDTEDNSDVENDEEDDTQVDDDSEIDGDGEAHDDDAEHEIEDA